MLLLISLGFFEIGIWDVLDITIVGILLFQLYKLLRGSLALNIVVGLLSLYLIWFLVRQLHMDLLAGILEQFVNVGVIALIIIFQPEVRRFLLLLGNTTLRRRSQLLGRLFEPRAKAEQEQNELIDLYFQTLTRMSRNRVGALIVLVKETIPDGVINGGVDLNARLSQQLLESIFAKESPLHDGAVIIRDRTILRASTILPVCERTDLPKSAGLRHRAAVGVTERAPVQAWVVSEESGAISFSEKGSLQRKLDKDELRALLAEKLFE